MATQQVILTTTVTATASLKQQCLVGYTGALPEKGTAALGIAEADAVTGDATPVNCLGILAAVAGGVVAAGDTVQAGDNGKLIKKEATGTPVALGTALTAASADGATFRVMWKG